MSIAGHYHVRRIDREMMEQQVTVNELKGKEWEKVLRDIADQRSRVAVVLPDGREVIIEP